MFPRKRVIAIGTAVVLIPVVAIAWWLLSPLLMNTTVDEEFPFAFNAEVPPDMTRAGVEQIMEGMAKVDQEIIEAMPEPVNGGSIPEAMADAMTGAVMDVMSESMIDAVTKTSIESMPGNTPDEMKNEMAQAIPEAMKDALADAMKEVMAQAMSQAVTNAGSIAASPVKVKAGDFAGVDRFHTGSGRAAIYRLPDGSSLLRLEDFEVTNGPDLRVILTSVRNPEGAGDVTALGHLEVAKLKGNRGNQNYEIPGGVDITSFQSVVIFCSPFRVIFSVAPLQDIT